MAVEIIGWIAPRVSSEIVRAMGPPFDARVVAETARVHERADFDRVLIGYFSNAPDGFIVGAHAAAVTERLGFLLAHRPGFVAPTVAARKLATLDQLCSGRLAVHLIAGGNDADQARDGDFLDHAGRYRRTQEYAGILRRSWLETAPFDHDGEFYRLRGAQADVRCAQEPHLPIYGGGGSAQAVEALAPHVDTFMLWGEPLAETAAFIARVRAAAAASQRAEASTARPQPCSPPRTQEPRFSVSTRPILAETDAKAWDRARDILARIEGARRGRTPPAPENEGSRRLLDVAARGEVHDRCLWTPLAAATGAPGNSTALVGTPDTVAEALLDYYDLGVDTLLIRGYDPLPDAEGYGRDLIPRVRELVARRPPRATETGALHQPR